MSSAIASALTMRMAHSTTVSHVAFCVERFAGGVSGDSSHALDGGSAVAVTDELSGRHGSGASPDWGDGSTAASSHASTRGLCQVGPISVMLNVHCRDIDAEFAER